MGSPSSSSRDRQGSCWRGALIDASGDAKEALKHHSWGCPREFGKMSREFAAMPTGNGITPTNIDWEPVESDRDGPPRRDVLLVALTLPSGAAAASSLSGCGRD